MSGDMYADDGGIYPDGVDRQEGGHERDHIRQYGIYKGRIVKTYFPDDPRSSVEGRVEYSVRINGQDFDKAIDIRRRGGAYDYQETHRGETTVNVEGGELDVGTYDEKTDGEMVWVMFVAGNTDFPLIIGGGEHPFSRQYRKSVGKDPVSLKNKGIEDVQELNGLEFSINNKGDYCIENVGRKDIKQDGKIIDEEAVGGKITFYGNGDYEIKISDEVNLKFTKADKKLFITVQGNKFTMGETGVSIEDKAGNKISLTDSSMMFDAVKDFIVNATKDITLTATGKIAAEATGEAEFKGTASTKVGTAASNTDVDGLTVALAGGGAPIARLGDLIVGTGFAGFPVIGNIAQGSPKVISG